jgi:hypothetical protein
MKSGNVAPDAGRDPEADSMRSAGHDGIHRSLAGLVIQSTVIQHPRRGIVNHHATPRCEESVGVPQ